MKPLHLLPIIALFAAYTTFAQTSPCDQLIKKYADQEGVTVVNLSGNFLNSFIDDEDNQNTKLTSIKILSIDDEALNKKLNFFEEVIPKLNKEDYKKAMDVKSDGEEFVILFKEKKNRITEAIIVSGGKENTLIQLTGSLSMDEVKIASSSFSKS
ncbi:DUF4252 domain-containing protein [Reichenbachiella versicolor]|uniref:DUF4252 domain-containing protein n=1 Tax=Reichenbachiella versicolor TaxID=1821036 RepID=UPI000D6E0D03|nr:DUF4252 domain-containing protein [Reichenbachiella versicolor]